MFRSHMWYPHINIHAQRHSCWYHLPVYICFQPFAASLVFKHISATIGGFGTFQCWISYLCTCHDLCYLINNVSLLAGPNCLDHYIRNESKNISYNISIKSPWNLLWQSISLGTHPTPVITGANNRPHLTSSPGAVNNIDWYKSRGVVSGFCILAK